MVGVSAYPSLEDAMFRSLLPLTLVSLLTVACTSAAPAAEGRRVICLDGSWQIAEGPMDPMPEKFDHTVAVPGLADMAQPPFAAVGQKESTEHREAFWYRRTFTL